ncbi:hypothetical protein X975_09046, partial [Stegodyphus mimosarum]
MILGNNSIPIFDRSRKRRIRFFSNNIFSQYKRMRIY